MTASALSRRTKALTLLPIALASAAWSAGIVTTGAVAERAYKSSATLPGGGAMLEEPMRDPANVTVPGSVAPAVPVAKLDQVVASASTSSIPAPALTAYQRAAQIMGRTDTQCRIAWELIAAVGRVESNHGQHAGNTLNGAGVASPGIYGPPLDGRPGTRTIFDTDAGELDRDRRFDRAVGPMQFLPTTWSVVKVDADGDGRRNPQDIDDAALSAAVYLCSGPDNLATRDGRSAALLRYNHSREYVELVLRIAEGYASGEYTALPSGAHVFSPAVSSPVESGKPDTPGKGGGSAPAGQPGTVSSQGGPPSGAAPTPAEPSPTPAPSPAPAPAPTPAPAPAPAPAPGPAQHVVEVVESVTTTVCTSPLGTVAGALGNCP